MAEFAYNNSIHSSTRYSPFIANTGYHPRWMILEHLDISNNPTFHERCHAQASYKKATDRHRLDSGSNFEP
jgi:hypothetical protein